jgi:hypothetical protein
MEQYRNGNLKVLTADAIVMDVEPWMFRASPLLQHILQNTSDTTSTHLPVPWTSHTHILARQCWWTSATQLKALVDMADFLQFPLSMWRVQRSYHDSISARENAILSKKNGTVGVPSSLLSHSPFVPGPPDGVPDRNWPVLERARYACEHVMQTKFANENCCPEWNEVEWECVYVGYVRKTRVWVAIFQVSEWHPEEEEDTVGSGLLEISVLVRCAFRLLDGTCRLTRTTKQKSSFNQNMYTVVEPPHVLWNQDCGKRVYSREQDVEYRIDEFGCHTTLFRKIDI